MTFSEEIVKQAWEASGGRCPCESDEHWENGVHDEKDAACGRKFRWENRLDFDIGWKAVQREVGDDFSLENCVIVCANCADQLMFERM